MNDTFKSIYLSTGICKKVSQFNNTNIFNSHKQIMTTHAQIKEHSTFENIYFYK